MARIERWCAPVAPGPGGGPTARAGGPPHRTRCRRPRRWDRRGRGGRRCRPRRSADRAARRRGFGSRTARRPGDLALGRGRAASRRGCARSDRAARDGRAARRRRRRRRRGPTGARRTLGAGAARRRRSPCPTRSPGPVCRRRCARTACRPAVIRCSPSASRRRNSSSSTPQKPTSRSANDPNSGIARPSRCASAWLAIASTPDTRWATSSCAVQPAHAVTAFGGTSASALEEGIDLTPGCDHADLPFCVRKHDAYGRTS